MILRGYRPRSTDILDSMAIDRARCRGDVQQARLSLHVPLLTNGPSRYVIGLRMCKVRTGSTRCALGAPQRQVPAMRVVHASCTLKRNNEVENTLTFVYIRYPIAKYNTMPQLPTNFVKNTHTYFYIHLEISYPLMLYIAPRSIFSTRRIIKTSQ